MSYRPCSYPTCSELIDKGSRCKVHESLDDRSIRRKGKKVYNSKKWSTRRIGFLREHPQCSVLGCPNLALHVDHINPIGTDGTHPFDESNWQSLCAHHHSIKTSKEVWKRK